MQHNMADNIRNRQAMMEIMCDGMFVVSASFCIRESVYSFSTVSGRS